MRRWTLSLRLLLLLLLLLWRHKHRRLQYAKFFFWPRGSSSKHELKRKEFMIICTFLVLIFLDNKLLRHAFDDFAVEALGVVSGETDVFGEIIGQQLEEFTIPAVVK